MSKFDICVDGDHCWPELAEREIIEVDDNFRVAGLSHGMSNGKPSVAFRIDLPDGRIVFAQTSLSHFLTAADMLKARHGDPRDK